jgi:hypothetical protein
MKASSIAFYPISRSSVIFELYIATQIDINQNISQIMPDEHLFHH